MHLVADHLGVSEMGCCIAVSYAWKQVFCTQSAVTVLHRQFGEEDGEWLARISPAKRKQALQCFVAPEMQSRYVCKMVADENMSLERESHSIVALPSLLWDAQSQNSKDILAKVIVYGGIPKQEFSPLGSSILITIRGNLVSDNVRAMCESIASETTPPARCSHAALWLDSLSAMVIYGGRGYLHGEEGDDNPLGDVWLLEQMGTSNSEWRWREAQVADSNASSPPPRCNFASCRLSGRSFFIHGGHNRQATSKILDDAWVCWIDDGFDDLDDFDNLSMYSASKTRGLSCSSFDSEHLRRQVSDQLTRQVSDSYRRLAPQVSVHSEPCSIAEEDEKSWRNDVPGISAVWRRVEADGPKPPRSCGHAAVHCRDAIVIHGSFNNTSETHELGPIHILQGLADPKCSPSRVRPRYTKVLLPTLSPGRAFSTLHSVAGRPLVLGGWDSSGSVEWAWHASCRMPVSEDCGPLIAVYGGRNTKGETLGQLLVLLVLNGSH